MITIPCALIPVIRPVFRRALHLGAQLSLFCGPLALADDETKELVGEWRVVALQSRGKQDSKVSFEGMIWKFDQSEYLLTPGATTPAGLAGKRSVTIRYSVDNEQLPKHFAQTLTPRSDV